MDRDVDRVKRPRGADDDMFRAGRALGQAASMLNSAVAERLGLHPTCWECMSLLFEHGPMPAGRLAQLTGLTSGAVTGLVDRLEAAGYVQRRRDASDRRKVIVDVVPAALADFMPIFEPMLADMQELNSRYSDDELRRVQRCVQGAADILRRHALRIRAGTAGDAVAQEEASSSRPSTTVPLGESR